MSYLAPRPDASTGEPRPPRAPLNITPAKRSSRAARPRVPQPPCGEGPVLEWFQQSARDSVKSGVLLSVLCIGFLCLKDWGVAWMDTWWLWAIVLVPVPLFYLYGRVGAVSAGADWFAAGRKRFVKLYELTEVTVTNPVGFQAWELELTDRHGGTVSVALLDIQQYQELWDLVYNGIAHSVLRGGASANDRALEMLQLQWGRLVRER